MSRIAREKKKCFICHEKHEYQVVLSTNTFGGGPDLDLRPAEMQRSTMPYWVHECPTCGYVTEEVSRKTTVTEQFLKSEKYLTCDGISFASELAKKFYKFYLICVEDQKTEDAFLAVLHAAWASDDEDDLENAVICRKLAIPLAAKVIEEKSEHKAYKEDKEAIMVMKADIMRRAGEFEQMIAEYADVSFSGEMLNQILAFEITKAKEKDAGCYRMQDV